MRWSVEDGKRGWLWKQSSNEVRLSIGRAAFGTQQAQEVLIGITVVIAGKIFRAVQTEGVCVGGVADGYYKTESLELVNKLPINTFIFEAMVDMAV